MKKLLAALLFVPAMAHAEFWTGNDLYGKLQSVEVYDRMHGLGYVMGTYDAQVHVYYCPKSENLLNAGQLRDIVFQYLSTNPGQRHRPAYALIMESFRALWPCPNRTPSRGA